MIIPPGPFRRDEAEKPGSAMGVLSRACLSRGLLPFTNFNRLHVVPPCTTSEEEAREGLAILDEALGEVDRFYGR